MTSRLGTLARDAAVYGLLDVANRFVGVFLVPLYTRLLVPAEYGAIELTATFITVVYVFVSLGLDSAVTHFYNREPEEERGGFTSAAILTVLTSSLTIAATLYLARRRLAQWILPGVADGATLLAIAAATLPLMALAAFQILFLRITFRRRQFAFLSLSAMLVNVSLNFVFIVGLKLGAKGILFAQLGSSLVSTIVGAWLTREFLRPRLSALRARMLLRYGAPLVVPNVAFWLSTYLERYVLGAVLGMTSIALFTVASKVAAVVTLVSSAIDYAWMPFAMSIQKQHDAAETYGNVLTYYVLICGFAGTVLAIFGSEVLWLVGGATYHAAYAAVGPLVAALLARGVINIVAIGSFVTGRTSLLASASIGTLTIQVALLVTLVPLLGVAGAALATVASRCFTAGWIHWRSKAQLHVPYRWDLIARSVAVFVVAGAMAIPLGRLSLPVAIGVKLLVLCPALTLALLAVTRIHRDAAALAAWGALRERLARVRHSGRD